MKFRNVAPMLIVTLMGLCLLSACGTVAEPPYAAAAAPTALPTLDAAMIEHGIEVYKTQYCGMCHTLAVADTKGALGPDHSAEGTIAQERIQDADYTGTATTSEDYIRESILEPQVYRSPDYKLSNHQMPSYSHLPPEDIDALVYLLTNQVDGS